MTIPTYFVFWVPPIRREMLSASLGFYQVPAGNELYPIFRRWNWGVYCGVTARSTFSCGKGFIRKVLSIDIMYDPARLDKPRLPVCLECLKLAVGTVLAPGTFIPKTSSLASPKHHTCCCNNVQ